MGALEQIDRARLPVHIAIVMDGNGRWATSRGLARTEGHRRGTDSVSDVVRAARELGVRHLTLNAFSAQNWRRERGEVATLMDLLHDYLERERAEIMDNAIRLTSIGEIERLPPHVHDRLAALMRDSAGNGGMTLTLALSYGGREELVRAAQASARAAVEGRVVPGGIDEAFFAAQLYTAGSPDPDLVIRTSGEQRVSNFLLWQISYAELYFSETLWPDFRREELYAAIAEFQRRRRRFGMTDEQIARRGT